MESQTPSDQFMVAAVVPALVTVQETWTSPPATAVAGPETLLRTRSGRAPISIGTATTLLD